MAEIVTILHDSPHSSLDARILQYINVRIKINHSQSGSLNASQY